MSRPFTERHHSLLLPTRPHACQPSHRHAYRSLFRHMLATQRQHNDHDDDDDDVALQDLDKRYYPLNHASLRPSRFLFKRQQLFFFNRNIPLELSTLIFGIKEERGINGFRDHNQFSLAIYGKFLFFFFFFRLMNHLTIQFWKFLTNKSFFFLYEKIRMEIQFEIHGMIYERKFLFFFFFFS